MAPARCELAQAISEKAACLCSTCVSRSLCSRLDPPLHQASSRRRHFLHDAFSCRVQGRRERRNLLDFSPLLRPRRRADSFARFWSLCPFGYPFISRNCIASEAVELQAQVTYGQSTWPSLCQFLQKLASAEPGNPCAPVRTALAGLEMPPLGGTLSSSATAGLKWGGNLEARTLNQAVRESAEAHATAFANG